jgi:hypothetical protein
MMNNNHNDVFQKMDINSIMIHVYLVTWQQYGYSQDLTHAHSHKHTHTKPLILCNPPGYNKLHHIGRTMDCLYKLADYICLERY